MKKAIKRRYFQKYTDIFIEYYISLGIYFYMKIFLIYRRKTITRLYQRIYNNIVIIIMFIVALMFICQLR